MKKDNLENKFKLSVCLITYNHKSFIQQAIDSVLSQKVDFEWEFIIADDCSTDGTREILINYQQKHSFFIKLILQSQNVGAANNWCNLLQAASGQYIAYFEGDDYWTDNFKLQKQIDFLDFNPEFAICAHKILIDREGQLVDYYSSSGIVPFEEADIQELAITNFLATVSVVFRRKDHIINNLNKLTLLPIGDYVLNLLNAQEGKIKVLNEYMAVYREHIGGSWSKVAELKRFKLLHFTLKTIIEEGIITNVFAIENLKKQIGNISLTLYWKVLDDKEKWFYLQSLAWANPSMLDDFIRSKSFGLKKELKLFIKKKLKFILR